MNHKITDVGIDMDGVLYPFADAFRDYCAERMGKLFLPEPTHWNFYEDWDLDKATFEQWVIDAAKSHDVFYTQNPYEGVLEAWADLKEMELKIHVLTARPQEAWAQTAEWLEKHDLKVDSLHFGPKKAFFSKIPTGKGILIDDHVAYYEEAALNGVIPVLLDRPWNQDKKKAMRVQDLPSFVSIIKGYNMSASTKTSDNFYDTKTPYKYSQTRGIHEWTNQKGSNGFFQSTTSD